jgi:ethanolamine transporter EutH
MKELVLKYGLISGGIIAAMTAVLLPLCMRGTIDFERSELFGYASMVLAFLLVFFGIRSYREEVGEGAISFAKGVQVGLLITLVACAVYVLCWEIVYWGFYPDFLDDYSARVIEKMRENGETEAAIRKMEGEMATFGRLYANPLFNVGITFLEVFPVGLVMTLVSAAILRRRSPPDAPAAALA